MAADNVGWDAVDDVMGGKPQLVSNGIAIAARPTFVDPWQWDNPHWRPAVVKTASGQGWLVVAGGSRGVGIQSTTWAKMLVQMGARNDSGHRLRLRALHPKRDVPVLPLAVGLQRERPGGETRPLRADLDR